MGAIPLCDALSKRYCAIWGGASRIGEHLTYFLLVLQIQDHEATMTVLMVLAVLAVLVMTAARVMPFCKLNPPFPTS